MSKTHEEISLQLVATMTSVDEITEDLISVISPDNKELRSKILNRRGLIMAELAFFEGLHCMLKAGRETSNIQPAPMVARHQRRQPQQQQKQH